MQQTGGAPHFGRHIRSGFRLKPVLDTELRSATRRVNLFYSGKSIDYGKIYKLDGALPPCAASERGRCGNFEQRS
jgi:hypothetical protein